MNLVFLKSFQNIQKSMVFTCHPIRYSTESCICWFYFMPIYVS